MIGTTFVDTQDAERFVRPIKDCGTEYLCEVFWMSNGRSVPGGRVTLTKRLFDPNSTIGFRPWNPLPPEENPEEDNE